MPHPSFPPDQATYLHPVVFGSVYWVNFTYPDLPAGVEERRILSWRPALVISSTVFAKYAGVLNVLPMAAYKGKLRPYHHLLLKSEYPLLDGDSLVKTELVYPLLRMSLPDQHYICRLHEHDLAAVLRKLADTLCITAYYELREPTDMEPALPPTLPEAE
ncbi:MAG TPA: type II toxin-antitoxin system PemK/MazF family toxin [Ktedonobacterales bacterium]|nr:type II toxin-antitoxin system PemK/MazF family toxin [Ktedonobacterales bacterium]